MDSKKAMDVMKKFGQSHIFNFFSELKVEEKKEFLSEIEKIDIENLLKKFQISTNPKKKEKEVVSPPHPSSIQNIEDKEFSSYFSKGLELIKQNSVGLLLLSGGQGTRLGYNKPKGMYPHLGLPSKSTLFQIQGNRIKKLENLSGGKLHWYILTSRSTFNDVKNYFAEQKYFGLQEDQIHLFIQPQLPCLTTDGKLILKDKSSLAKAPNGNGAVYEALKASGMLEDMKKRGIKHVYSYCVDNILVKVGDPVFIAKCAETKCEFGSKVIPKRSPHERVGVFALKDGKYNVIEYSEITKEMAEAKKKNSNELLYNESNIVNFYYHIDFLEKCCNEKFEVYHVAKKDIPTIDKDGKHVKVKGVKLELFNFDICKMAKSVTLVKGMRDEDFSPLKNKAGSGNNCRETCLKDYSKYCLKLIEKNGGIVEKKGVKEDDMICEIVPLVSYAGEGLEKIVKGNIFKFPIYIK